MIQQISKVAKSIDDTFRIRIRAIQDRISFSKIVEFPGVNGNSCRFPLFNLRLKESLLGRLF